MTSETINPPQLQTMRIEIDGEIGTLTLDRPDAFNAMSPEMIGEMTVAFAWLADRAPLRGLIVTGAGRPSAPAATSPGSAKGSSRRRSTCPPTCGAGPRSCTRRSSICGGFRIR